MSQNNIFRRGVALLAQKNKELNTPPVSAAASVAPGSGRKVSVAGSGMKRRRMSTQSYGAGVTIPK